MADSKHNALEIETVIQQLLSLRSEIEALKATASTPKKVIKCTDSQSTTKNES